MRHFTQAGLLALAVFGMAACQQGSAERAGERLDSNIEEATEGRKDLADGPLENAGEEIDEANEDLQTALTPDSEKK